MGFYSHSLIVLMFIVVWFSNNYALGLVHFARNIAFLITHKNVIHFDHLFVPSSII